MIKNICWKSDKGLRRDVNQDALYVDTDERVGIFVIADGMGGYEHGDLASSYVVAELEKWWKQQDKDMVNSSFDAVVEDMKQCVFRIHEYLYRYMTEQSMVGGTTLCILLVSEDKYAVLNVGDSRTYVRVKNDVKLLTIDDVWENSSLSKDYKTIEQKQEDERYGKLTQAVGGVKEISIGTYISKKSKKARFLMCSDGVYKYCTDVQIKNILCRSGLLCTMKKRIKLLEQIVLESGAPDNYSFIIFDMS